MGTRLRTFAVPATLGLTLVVLWFPPAYLPRGTATVTLALLAGLVGRFRWLAAAVTAAALASALLWVVATDIPGDVVGATILWQSLLALAAILLGRALSFPARRRFALR
jgi:hypothetical protein